jgi:hypothetical protein
MDLSLLNGGGSFPVGAALQLPDNMPIQISDDFGTWLRTEYIETNPANFDGAYWDHTRATLWAKRLEYTNRSINGASANGNTIVAAVGHNGTDPGGLAVSTDNGITWGSLIVPSGLTGTQNVNAVKWVSALSLWVAVSSNGLIWTSTDAVTWTPRTSGTTNALNAINFANGLLAIVGASGTILTSANGTSYTVRTSNVTSALVSVAFYNNVWLAVGTSTASQSSRSTDNGVTWTAVTTPGGGTNVSRVITGNNLFVLVVANIGVYTSTTGATGSWTQVLTGTLGLANVSYNGEFYIFTNNNTLFYKSFDLTKLRPYPHGVGGNATATFLNITDGRFLATGSDAGSGSGRVLIGNQLAYAGNPSFAGTQPTSLGNIGTAFYVRIK